ncbi:hypothetical protein [Sinomonas sp.]|uniref:hypothetical protein n=1 Tax=Sinomonas sp. TaxID=1914986 RepID=UPI003F7FC3DF
MTALTPPPPPPPAPAVEDDRPPRTTPWLWFAAYFVIMGLVAARVPTVVREAAARMPEDVKRELSPNALDMATTVAGIAFIGTYAVVMALYLWLVAFLDKRILRTKASLGPLKVGLYFAIVVASTVPVHLLAVLAQVAEVRSFSGYYVYFPLVVAALLAAYRKHWLGLPGRRKALVILVAAAVPLLAILG